MALNKVFLTGNLTRDPATRYTPSGTAICDIGVASSHKYKAQNGEMREEVTFVDVTYFGRIAEVCQQYLVKGAPVLVEGRLKLDKWQDKNTGENRYKMKVVGETMQMLGRKSDSGGGGGGAQANESQDSEPVYADSDSEIPF